MIPFISSAKMDKTNLCCQKSGQQRTQFWMWVLVTFCENASGGPCRTCVVFCLYATLPKVATKNKSFSLDKINKLA